MYLFAATLLSTKHAASLDVCEAALDITGRSKHSVHAEREQEMAEIFEVGDEAEVHLCGPWDKAKIIAKLKNGDYQVEVEHCYPGTFGQVAMHRWVPIFPIKPDQIRRREANGRHFKV